MGSVAQAVVEFDEAVQAPWRPSLASGSAQRSRLRAVPDLPPPPAYRGAGAERSAAGVDDRRRHPAAERVRRPVPAGSAPPRRPAPHGADAGSRAVPAVRLTRRARRLGVVLGLAIGIALGSWVGSVVAGDGGGLRLAGESSVVVQQGDTLWSIAASVVDDGADVRAVIADIQARNDLPDATVVPGQVLVIP